MPISAPDYSYLGSGHVLIREFGAAAPFLAIGNCSALGFSPQLNTLQLPDFTNPGGGTRNRVDRVTDVQFNFTFHDFKAENYARFLRGTAADVASGTVAAEPVVGYKGGFVPLAKYANAISSVEPVGGGVPYTAGTDYELDRGGLFLPAGSTIPNPVAGAPNFEVDYAYDAHSVAEALTTAAKWYTLLFLGLNEARSGKAVRATAHKITGGVLAEMALLGEDYGGGEVSGSLLPDDSKGPALSKYLQILMVT